MLEHWRQSLVNIDTINFVQSEFVFISVNRKINKYCPSWALNNRLLETFAEISFSHDTFFFKLHLPFFVEAAPTSSLARSISANSDIKEWEINIIDAK